MSTIVNISQAPSNDNPVAIAAVGTPGTYLGVLTRNGRQFVVDVTVGASDIEIPNILDANTLHTLKIFESDGVTLLDDTIYNIQVTRVVNTDVNNVHTIDFVTAGQASYTSQLFKGASRIQVVIEKENEIQFTHSGPDSDTINFINRLGEGQQGQITVFR